MPRQDWLYDEGEDETKGVYEAKLKELQALGEPLLARAWEAEASPAAAAALQSTANRLIAIASANDAKHAHIPQDDKNKVSWPPIACMAVIKTHMRQQCKYLHLPVAM